MYYFSSLALTLNEPEEGVAPTDSRRRPDQRLMEQGMWEEANSEKQRLEEKQRTVRREREREREAAQLANTEDSEGRTRPGAEGHKGRERFIFDLVVELVLFLCVCVCVSRCPSGQLQGALVRETGRPEDRRGHARLQRGLLGG